LIENKNMIKAHDPKEKQVFILHFTRYFVSLHSDKEQLKMLRL